MNIRRAFWLLLLCSFLTLNLIASELEFIKDNKAISNSADKIQIIDNDDSMDLHQLIATAKLKQASEVISRLKNQKNKNEILNHVTESGMTALHTAVFLFSHYSNPNQKEEYLKIANELIDAGADTTIKNKIGLEPFDYSPEVKKIFADKYASEQFSYPSKRWFFSYIGIALVSGLIIYIINKKMNSKENNISNQKK